MTETVMNVLLTSSGRRTYLVEYFRQALDGRGLVFAANSVLSPAMMCADGSAVSPLIYSEEYVPWLLEFCEKNGIGLVVPLFDVDLPVLARSREQFERKGITVAVSGLGTVCTASDKQAMSRKLTEAGIGCPECTADLQEARRMLQDGRMHWPAVIKPRFGCGSIGLFTADDPEELDVLYRKCGRKTAQSYLRYESASHAGEDVLIQEMKQGTEYGLDVICDFHGSYRTTVVRRKVAMRSGETDEAVVLGEEEKAFGILNGLGRRLSELFDIRGCMDVDVIMDPEEQVPYVIDMNARFGGGYPFSHLAGVDLPRAYVAWAQNEKEPAGCLKAAGGVHGYKDIGLKAYPG